MLHNIIIITYLKPELRAGLAKEFDRPANLIERPSLFGALVQEYANRSSDM
jgi:hypothetical protein